MSEAEALKAADERAASALALLRGWVETNSFSGAVDNVNAMGTRLREAFALDGLSCEVTPGNGVGDHLVWCTPAWQSGGGVLLVGHHDTVFPPQTFEGWQEAGDRVRGPGALDMKGGLVVVHTALAALADVGALASTPVAVVCVGDEEIGSPDSAPLTARLAKRARAALVFEAGRARDAIITQRKGTGAVKVQVRGKAAHAGNHHADGINAIWALSRLVDAAQGLTDYERGVTLNVGVINGGSSKNTVPEHAEAQMDFRFVRASDGEELMRRLSSQVHELAEQTGARFTLEGGIRRPPLEKTSASGQLYAQYAACARESGLGDVESPLLGGGSDANNIAALGVPAIDGLGPRGAGFHTHDEYIEASSLSLKSAALLRYLLRHARG